MRQKRKRSSRSRRRSHSLITPLSVLFVMLAVCAGAYWNSNADTPLAISQTTAASIEQLPSGSTEGKDAVYTQVSAELQDAVESWLQAQHADISTIKTEDRQEHRRATGGLIRWTTKSLLVVPSKTFSRQDLEKQLSSSKGKVVVYRAEKTTLDGKNVTEYDIAYFEMLDKEQLYLVMDKLYVTAPKSKPSLLENIKEFILGSTSGSLKDVPAKAVSEKPETASKQAADSKQNHPAQVKGRLAIVIDDCGSDMTTLEKLNKLPIPLTYSVMPNKAHTTESAQSGYQAGRKIFVHLPMQPLNVSSSESVFIGSDMSDNKVKSTTNELLDQVPHAIGMNNHQGSMATADTRLMKDVMSVMKKRKLVYLDSRTNSTSVGEQTAASMGIATSRNNLFIDNDADVSAIKQRLRQGGEIAKSNGSAIIIGHCRPKTAQALSEMLDELHKEGIEIVFVTELMQ